MADNFSQDVQHLPDSQDGFNSLVQLYDHSALLSSTTTSMPISYGVEINESSKHVFDPKSDKATEDNKSVVPVKPISSQVSSQKSDVNASFSESDDFSSVSIPSPPISPQSVKIWMMQKIKNKEIKEFDKFASKISRKLKFGNNLLRISKQQYIKVENMVDRLSS